LPRPAEEKDEMCCVFVRAVWEKINCVLPVTTSVHMSAEVLLFDCYSVLIWYIIILEKILRAVRTCVVRTERARAHSSDLCTTPHVARVPGPQWRSVCGTCGGARAGARRCAPCCSSPERTCHKTDTVPACARPYTCARFTRPGTGPAAALRTPPTPACRARTGEPALMK